MANTYGQRGRSKMRAGRGPRQRSTVARRVQTGQRQSVSRRTRAVPSNRATRLARRRRVSRVNSPMSRPNRGRGVSRTAGSAVSRGARMSHGRSTLNASATNLGKRRTGRSTIAGAPPRGGRNFRTTVVGKGNHPSRNTGLE